MKKGRMEYSCQSAAVPSRGASTKRTLMKCGPVLQVWDDGARTHGRTHARTAAIVHRNEVNEDGVAPSKGLHIDVNL